MFVRDQSGKNEATVTVVGAGIIGTAIAYRLLASGTHACLIDRDVPGSGASFGNMAGVAVTEFLPASTPSVWKKIPGWLLHPEGPICLRPSYLLRLLPWLLKFLRAGTSRNVEQLLNAAVALCSRAGEDWLALLRQSGLMHMLNRSGCLRLYRSEQERAQDRAHVALMRRFGFECHELDAYQTRKLEPGLAASVDGAVLQPQWWSFENPFTLTTGLAKRCVELGAPVLQRSVVAIDVVADRARALIFDDGSRQEVSRVILACGAWTARLAKAFGETIPLETERGYHVQACDPKVSLRHSLIVPSQAFVVAPVAGGVRVGGTVELAGLDAPPNYRRATVLGEQARTILPGLQLGRAAYWMGHRPALPDTLPLISRSARLNNVFYATGHGHLGMTLAATTAELMLDLIGDRRPALDLTPYDVRRF